MEEDKSSLEELIDVDEEITSLLEEEVETLPQYIVEELIIEELLEELIGSLLFPHEFYCYHLNRTYCPLYL